MKKWIAALLSVMLLNCVSIAAADSFTGYAEGFGGLVSVTLTIESNGRITGAVVKGENETPGIGQAPIADGTFARRIIEAQSANIDVVSGVTHTSNAVITATRDALL